MAMDRIQGPNLTRQGALKGFRNTQQTDNQHLGGDTAPAGAPSDGGKAAPTRDQAVISQAGRQLVDLRQAVDTGRAALEALPDVRQQKVDQARKRLDQGFYQSPAVREEVAGKLSGVLAALDKLTP